VAVGPGEPLRCRTAFTPDVPGFTAYVAATGAALLVYSCGALLFPRGIGRRVTLVGCLLWVAGWIAVAPSTAPEPPGRFYAVAVAVGTLLGCAAVAARALDADGGAFPGDSLPMHLAPAGGPTPLYLALAGCAFAVPGLVGPTLGSEVLVLLFAVATAVVALLLFLFR